MRKNKFELIFYLKIPGIIGEDGEKAIYLPATDNPSERYRRETMSAFVQTESAL